MNLIGVHEFNPPSPVPRGSGYVRRGRLWLQAGTNDGHFGLDQRHSLALHVRSHQRTVGVVMLQEGIRRRSNQRSGSGPRP